VITVCDTGPLVAFLNRNDPCHSWAVALMKQVRSLMLTTEPVLTEVAYFLRTDRVDVDPLFQLLERDAVRVDLQVAAHWPRLRTLMARDTIFRIFEKHGCRWSRDCRAASGDAPHSLQLAEPVPHPLKRQTLRELSVPPAVGQALRSPHKVVDSWPPNMINRAQEL